MFLMIFRNTRQFRAGCSCLACEKEIKDSSKALVVWSTPGQDNPEPGDGSMVYLTHVGQCAHELTEKINADGMGAGSMPLNAYLIALAAELAPGPSIVQGAH